MPEHSNFNQVSVNLDQQDKQALEKINSMLDHSNIAPAVLAALHLYSWANMDMGITNFATEDWLHFAKTLRDQTHSY